MAGGLRVLLLVLGLVATAVAFSPTWSLYSSHSGDLGKTPSFPGLNYLRVLNFTNGTACSMLAFDQISFNGTDLGAPLPFLTGICYQEFFLSFGHPGLTPVIVGFHFADTPYHGTNVTQVTVRVVDHVIIKYTFIPTRRLFAARKRCYDCAADLTFYSGNTNITINKLRLQAFVPEPNGNPAKFSPRYDDSDCPTAPETGFDAALYFGIGIGILSGVGALLVIRHVIARRRTYASGYRPINSD